jgi:hypothetical protein
MLVSEYITISLENNPEVFILFSRNFYLIFLREINIFMTINYLKAVLKMSHINKVYKQLIQKKKHLSKYLKLCQNSLNKCLNI